MSATVEVRFKGNRKDYFLWPDDVEPSDTASGSSTVLCDGNPTCVKDSNFMTSTGDEAGSLLGIVSNKIKGKAEFVNFSFDVFLLQVLSLLLRNCRGLSEIL